MDILRRDLAPISSDAWKQIEQQTTVRLKGNLSARKHVGLSGPHGWNLASVSQGRLRLMKSEPREGIHWGLREVLPLMEVRVPFFLKLMEIDSVSRGLKNPDLAGLEEAAQKAAWFEESCIYFGFAEAGIEGMIAKSPHEPLTLRKQVDLYQEFVERAVVSIQKAGIGGPYVLVLGTEPYLAIMAGDQRGYPLHKRLEGILSGGGMLWSPALEGGVVYSAHEGNYELTIGQDFSIGYAGHSRDTVELYITESFTFQVLEPAAAVELKLNS
jgi:uncharacterized linocin/CFP29 family protein